MNKNNLIRNVLSARVSGFIEEAKEFDLISHGGLKGRFREIVLTRLLNPVLPSSCVCVHGTTVDSEGSRFPGLDEEIGVTEDDVLIVDRDLVPVCFIGEEDAIVPKESVLARVEVKSTLTRDDIKKTVEAAIKHRSLIFASDRTTVPNAECSQLIFAYKSNANRDELERLKEVFDQLSVDPENPPIQGVCVVGKGFWLFAGKPGVGALWKKISSDDQHSEVLGFLGVVCNTIPSTRWERKMADTKVCCLTEETELKELEKQYISNVGPYKLLKGETFDKLGSYLIDGRDVVDIDSNSAS